MRTLLDEILAAEKLIIRTTGQAPHSRACSCNNCCSHKKPVGHIAWRRRRDARRGSYHSFYDRRFDQEVGEFPKDNIFSMAQHSQGLKKFWTDARAKTTNPLEKARYDRYIKTIQNKTRPSWKQSEDDIYHYMYGGIRSPRYRHGTRNHGRNTKGNVIPDVFSTAMIEIKNFSMPHKNSMIHKLAKQIEARRDGGLPYDHRQQAVILDVRGQKVPLPALQKLGQQVVKATKLPQSNVQILTWEV